MLALLDDDAFLRGDTNTAYLERYVAESDWQKLPDRGGLPAELPAIITAVLYAHARQGAGKAVVSRHESASRWLGAGRREAMR